MKHESKPIYETSLKHNLNDWVACNQPILHAAAQPGPWAVLVALRRPRRGGRFLRRALGAGLGPRHLQRVPGPGGAPGVGSRGRGPRGPGEGPGEGPGGLGGVNAWNFAGEGLERNDVIDEWSERNDVNFVVWWWLAKDQMNNSSFSRGNRWSWLYRTVALWNRWRMEFQAISAPGPKVDATSCAVPGTSLVAGSW